MRWEEGGGGGGQEACVRSRKMERMAEEGGKLKRKCERELNERQWPRDVIERR